MFPAFALLCIITKVATLDQRASVSLRRFSIHRFHLSLPSNLPPLESLPR